MNKIRKYILTKLGIMQISKQVEDGNRILNEIIKSQKFHDSICECEWLKHKTFSPGRGAVDYSVLYSIFKVIDLMRPKSILEFGLGQSSKIIHQYSALNPDVYVVTVEHDLDWINFFKKSNTTINYEFNILMLEIGESNYKEHATLSYLDKNKLLNNKKYDFIIVDGPYGYFSYYYSRPNILDLVDNLNDDFCILVDDYDRNGEKNTVKQLLKLLKERKILFSLEVIKGEKDHILICSPSWNFITKV